MAKKDQHTDLSEESSSIDDKEIPSDLFSDKIPTQELFSLDGEVKEKPYAALPMEAVSESNLGNQEAPPNTGTITDSSESIPTSTPAPQAKTPEEVQSQASQAVDLILKGYDKLHGLGRYVGKFDQDELSSLHLEGKINLDQQLPIGSKTIKVGEFFQEYNAGIDENIVVSQEFNDSIRPPLTRIAIKRGWGVSDELYCGLILGEDLVTKVSMLIGLKKSANLVLNACMELMKKENSKKGDEKKQDDKFPTIEEGQEWKEPEGQQ